MVIANKNVEPINIGRSTLIISKPIFNLFPTIADTPKTRKILVILEPITSLTTISEALFKTAKIEVINSGSDVPIDTIVTPIKNAGSPKNIPIFSAESVK